MKKILSLLLITFLTSGMCSCGTRKVHKTETVEIVKKDSVSKTKEVAVSESETNKQVNISEDNFIIEPIDIIKPIEITDSSGKVTIYKNARIRHEIKSDKSFVYKVNKMALVKENEVKKSVSSKMEQSEKNIEKKNSFNWFWIGYIAIFIIVSVVYWRYRDRCWFI